MLMADADYVGIDSMCSFLFFSSPSEGDREICAAASAATRRTFRALAGGAFGAFMGGAFGAFTVGTSRGTSGGTSGAPGRLVLKGVQINTRIPAVAAVKLSDVGWNDILMLDMRK